MHSLLTFRMSATECLFVSETFVALEIQFDVIFIEIDERNDETSENALSTIHGSIRYNDFWSSARFTDNSVMSFILNRKSTCDSLLKVCHMKFSFSIEF